MTVSNTSGASMQPPILPTGNVDSTRAADRASFTDISGAQPTQTGTSPIIANLSMQLDPPQVSGSDAGTISALNQLSAQDMQADMFAVMALFTKIAQDQRNSAREMRHNEMQANVKTLLSAAQEIRNAADDRLTGAIMSGVMQIGAGAVQIGGAAANFKASTSALKENKAGNISDAQLGSLNNKAGAYSSGAGGAAQAMTGLGGIMSGIMEHEAAAHDAHKAELEAQAKAHEAGTQQAGDQMQQMQDILRDIRDKLSSMEQSRAETSRGIARNI